EAQKAYQRATAADPDFALAQYRLLVVTGWTEDVPVAFAALRRAQELRGRLSPRDRSLLDAMEADLTRSTKEAEQKYRETLRLYPDDVESWYELGEILFHGTSFQGRLPSESRAAFEHAVELDPQHTSSLVHLARLAQLDGDKPELIRVLDQ